MKTTGLRSVWSSIALTAVLVLGVDSFAFCQTSTELMEKGGELLNSGKALEAAEAFRASVKANPKEIGAWVGLGNALRAAGKPQEALEPYRKALDLNPALTEARIQLGGTLVQVRKADEGIIQLKRASDEMPLQPRPYVMLGAAYLQLRRYEDAKAAYQRAQGFAPDDAGPHIGLGQVYIEWERYREAVTEYLAAMRLNPTSRLTILGLVNAYNNLKETKDALRYIEPVAKSATRDAEVQLAYAIALDGEKRFEEAIRVYKDLIKLDPNLAIAWGNLGWTQYNAGKLDDAIASSREALKQDGSLAYVRFNIGLFLAVKGDLEGSKSEYLAAIKVSQPADVKSGIEDIVVALRAHPDSAVLKAVRKLLEK